MVKRTERGWAGHFICSDSCKFRRNTLLERGDKALVVSTVGAMFQNGKLVEVGPGRHYETLAFWADKNSGEYKDADVGEEIFFESKCGLKWHEGGYPDNEANDMHEDVIAELSEKLEKGDL